MTESKLKDDPAVCQDIYSTLSTCLPSWLTFQNIWSKQNQFSSDTAIAAYYPCPRESLTSESQTPSDAELPTLNLFEAPLSLEISPSARPQDVEFRRESDDLESKESITEQEGAREVNYFVDTSYKRTSDTPTGSGCGCAELPLSAAPAGPEIRQSDSLEHDDTAASSEAEEHSHLVQEGFTHYGDSPIKVKKQSRPRGRKALLKAAAKGRKILSRVFNRRNSIQ
ncbi:hypothetical protein Ndes2526B_g08079 [Nannochloris sp. 'desiccata']|nr:hypothetical protein KSW81_002717 [Chlorella desiccata (nom. nud.)]